MQQLIDENFFTVVIRILVALVLSGLIGFERELKNHSAGFRTHILVGVGACLMMLLSIYGFTDFMGEDSVRFDPARIPSYVISGIGFLGAGTIMVYGGTIRGLTTAASIWAVAGLGLVVGVGMYATAVFTTLVILLSLIFLNNFEKRFTRASSINILEIVVTNETMLHDLVAVLESYDLDIQAMEVEKSGKDLRHIYIKTRLPEGEPYLRLFDEISRLSFVQNISRRA